MTFSLANFRNFAKIIDILILCTSFDVFSHLIDTELGFEIDNVSEDVDAALREVVANGFAEQRLLIHTRRTRTGNTVVSHHLTAEQGKLETEMLA